MSKHPTPLVIIAIKVAGKEAFRRLKPAHLR